MCFSSFEKHPTEPPLFLSMQLLVTCSRHQSHIVIFSFFFCQDGVERELWVKYTFCPSGERKSRAKAAVFWVFFSISTGYVETCQGCLPGTSARGRRRAGEAGLLECAGEIRHDFGFGGGFWTQQVSSWR